MSVFSIHHITRYEYSRLVKESLNQVKIYPLADAAQQVLQQDVRITGVPDVHLYCDYWGNMTGVFSIAAPHKELVIDSRLTISIQPQELPFLDIGYREPVVDAAVSLLIAELRHPEQIQQQQLINTLVKDMVADGASTAATVWHCNSYVYNHFQYIKGITTYETTVDEILEHRSGVCQDFAHVLLQILRTAHISCRYVSGYICPNKNGMRGEGATHAWVEAWIPGYGWAGIDPTNNVWVTDSHVKLATGRNFNDCSPVKGLFKGLAKQQLSVYVSVGYEDGQVFEEINHVSTSAPDATVVADEEEPVPAPQEQQQQ